MAGFDKEGKPVCQPLDSVKDVLDWSANNVLGLHGRPLGLNDDEASRLLNRKCDAENRPKVLVCHDMMGGYLDDRFLQGCDNSEAYRFYHWHLIDTFVYFSHRFITIPPAGWVRAAHKNGVQILGTLITEWDGGARICQEFLRTRETIDALATKLADIAFICGFDGWLINIENVIQEKSIPDLQYFVQQVTHHCHSRLKDQAKVLWYDSVTHVGALDWQNELNDKNKLFFSVCDGIFLNYAITEKKLSDSRQTAAGLGNRCSDVYVGVDVFGRATPGGGGFNCSQVLKLISKYDLSIAIFAQGWVYENHGPELFDVNEMKFWKLIKDFLPRRIHSIPLQTSFCQGFGRRRYLHGKTVSEDPWHNLSLQQLQPCHGDGSGSSFTTTDAYNGGGCLRLSGSDSEAPGTSVVRLFNLSMDKGGGEPLAVQATWKDCSSDASCCLSLVLVPCDSPQPGSLSVSEKAVILVQNTSSDTADHKKFWDQFVKEGSGEACLKFKEKASLQFANATSCKEDSGWISSQWDVDTDWLLQDQNATHQQPQCVAVFALLVPTILSTLPSPDSQASPTNSSALLGNVQIQRTTPSTHGSVSQNPCVLGKVTCLGVKSCGPMSKHQVSIVQEEFDYLKKAQSNLSDTDAALILPPAGNAGICDAGTIAASTSSLSKQSCLFKNCRTTNGAAPEGSEKQIVSLHVLNWAASSDDRVDYYMVFAVDQSDSEHFIGCTASNSFVTVFDEGKESSDVVGYSIKAVLDNGALLSQKFSFSILQQ